MPVSTIGEIRAARSREPAFVYYKGVDEPAVLQGSGCVPVLRTFPMWLARLEFVNRLTNVELGTVCRLERLAD
jgi:hypothetical protein